MDPLTYISRLTDSDMKKPVNFEFMAIGVFVCIYVFVRLIESYVVPRIPSFLVTEVCAFVKWLPVLIPIIFGLFYTKK